MLLIEHRSTVPEEGASAQNCDRLHHTISAKTALLDLKHDCSREQARRGLQPSSSAYCLGVLVPRLEELNNDMTADEPRATGHENGTHC